MILARLLPKNLVFCIKKCIKSSVNAENIVPLHPQTRNRKVAQLVAHYVRDVGVGRSSRLFPTNLHLTHSS